MKTQIITQLKTLWREGAAHIFIGTFLTKFIVFFGSMFLIGILSKEDYGVLSYAENFYGYFYIVVGFGLDFALIRYVILGNTQEEKYSLFRYSENTGLILTIPVLLAAIAFMLIFPQPTAFSHSKWLYVIYMLALPFQFIISCSQFSLRAMFDNKVYAYVAAVISIALIGGRILGGLIDGVYGAIPALVVVTALLAVFLQIFVKRRYFRGYSRYTYMKPVKEKRKEVLSYSIQYMITNGLWAVFMLNDTLLLGQMIGDPNVVAEYRTAYIIPGNIGIISSCIGLFVGPYFTKWENEGKLDLVRKNYKKTFLINMSLMGIACATLFVFAKPILILLFGVRYTNAAPVMQILSIAAFMNAGLRYTSANLLASMGIIKYNMLVAGIGTIFQLAINIFVIPKYGTIGLAWTSVGIYAMMAIVLFIVFHRRFFSSSHKALP